MPLFLQSESNNDKESTKYYFLAHSALDIVEERGGCLMPIDPAAQHTNPYLGLLMTIEDTMMYVTRPS